MKHKSNKIDPNLINQSLTFQQSQTPLDDNVLKELINQSHELRALADHINQIQVKELKGLMTANTKKSKIRKIERIYSKQEIRNIVCTNLIKEYQNTQIIDAVTNYLYSLHVQE